MNREQAEQIKELFKGRFLAGPETLLAQLLKVKAYVFDWDGVFNDGFKNAGGSSPYNEVDSMGLNMLRFSHFLRTGNNPLVAVISGERNESAAALATREHFHSVYSGIKTKNDALSHFCAKHGLQSGEVLFMFDDVLDLSIARICGMRIMVSREASPMLAQLVTEKGWADYITAAGGGSYAIRETTELLMGLTGYFDEAILQRVEWSEGYQAYLKVRNSADSHFYIQSGKEIIQQTT